MENPDLSSWIVAPEPDWTAYLEWLANRWKEKQNTIEGLRQDQAGMLRAVFVNGNEREQNLGLLISQFDAWFKSLPEEARRGRDFSLPAFLRTLPPGCQTGAPVWLEPQKLAEALAGVWQSMFRTLSASSSQSPSRHTACVIEERTQRLENVPQNPTPGGAFLSATDDAAQLFDREASADFSGLLSLPSEMTVESQSSPDAQATKAPIDECLIRLLAGHSRLAVLTAELGRFWSDDPDRLKNFRDGFVQAKQAAEPKGQKLRQKGPSLPAPAPGSPASVPAVDLQTWHDPSMALIPDNNKFWHAVYVRRIETDREAADLSDSEARLSQEVDGVGSRVEGVESRLSTIPQPNLDKISPADKDLAYLRDVLLSQATGVCRDADARISQADQLLSEIR
jgi:hypothetical protein